MQLTNGREGFMRARVWKSNNLLRYQVNIIFCPHAHHPPFCSSTRTTITVTHDNYQHYCGPILDSEFFECLVLVDLQLLPREKNLYLLEVIW